jgi:xanthine dehydrogenase molybdenum-binding subunit
MNRGENMIGKSIKRVDAYDKATGKAKFTDDFNDKNTLVAKVLHSTIANGWVKAIDTSKAEMLEGVVRVVTCFDVPDITFSTPGHPWSMDESHRDVADRKMLNQRVRLVGDDIAAVVAVDEFTAQKALEQITVSYEELDPITDPFESMKPGKSEIHQGKENNILKHTVFGDEEYNKEYNENEIWINNSYSTPRVQHCHIENPVSIAWMEGDRICIMASTQIPHILRRIIGQALGIPWGKVRVIKPYVGGGFGNKQDALYEPLNAFLTTQVGGRRVKLELTREETFMCTRSRHRIFFDFKTAVNKKGRLIARYIKAVSDQGGYASHGHSVTMNVVNNFCEIYNQKYDVRAEAYTVYTNLGVSGAMRGYGIPQITFVNECLMDDIAKKIDMDPIEFRKINIIKEGFISPYTNIKASSIGLDQVIEKGKKYLDWDVKRRDYSEQSGHIRRGIGMALFLYKTGVYPISLETSSARMILNQDGSVQLQLGATEIGQGADTVFSQMAAETLGVDVKNVHIISTQDTDISPFDLGAYASRQTYVTGMAVKKTAEKFKDSILTYAAELLELQKEDLNIFMKAIINEEGDEVISLEALSENAFYNRDKGGQISAEVSELCKDNSFATGGTFAEVEVDMQLGKIKVIKIINIHDSGIIINPELAAAQVHGGMSMGLGYALSEKMKYNEKGKLNNGNLLDYKIETAIDTPKLDVEFVEIDDPTGPYGNKALGEPPTLSPAPAVRNAVLHATGVSFNELPLDPETLVIRFKKEKLI